MKTVILILSLFLAAGPVTAQTYRGQISDLSSGEAVVSLVSGTSGVTANITTVSVPRSADDLYSVYAVNVTLVKSGNTAYVPSTSAKIWWVSLDPGKTPTNRTLTASASCNCVASGPVAGGCVLLGPGCTGCSGGSCSLLLAGGGSGASSSSYLLVEADHLVVNGIPY